MGWRRLRGGVDEVWLLRVDKPTVSPLGGWVQPPGACDGRGSWREVNRPLTCTTRTRLSGYLVNTAEKASTGSRSTVESRAARADTVRWGCWWPWGRKESQGWGGESPLPAPPGPFPMPFLEGPLETSEVGALGVTLSYPVQWVWPTVSPHPSVLVTHSDDIQYAQEAVDTVPRNHFLHHTLLPVLKHTKWGGH